MTSFTSTYPKMAGKKQFRIHATNYGDVFLQSDFDAWYKTNSEHVSKFRNTYIVHEPANFKNIVSETNYLSPSLESNYLTRFNNCTVADLGSEITIGIKRNTRLLVFRRITLPSIDETITNVYVITENNTVTVKHPRLKVAVIQS